MYQNGYVRFQPSGQILPREFILVQKEVAEFTVREDDIWVAAFPKSGTTWTQEMVWNIVNNLDFDTARSVSIDIRVPFVEMSGIITKAIFERLGSPKSSMKFAASLPSPRILKTHLSVKMLPEEVLKKNAKLIYVSRNPRDVCVSFYHHWKLFHGWQGSFDTFFDGFVGDVCGHYAPFFNHVLGYLELQGRPNILFITFEEMKKDLPSVIRKTADFLGKSLSDEQIDNLNDHLMFENMRKNKALNREEKISALIGKGETGEFFRKGETGDWRRYMSPSQVDRIRDWEERHLKGTGLQFVNIID